MKTKTKNKLSPKNKIKENEHQTLKNKNKK